VTPEPTQWTLARVWEALRKFWLLIVGLALLGGGIGYAVSAATQPEYESRASLYFSLSQGTSGSDLNQGSTYTQNQMLSFARIATSSRVLDRVIDDLGLDTTPRDLARSVAVAIPQDTVVLDVTATSTDPAKAAAIANSVAGNLVAIVEEVAASSGDGAARITASLIDDAVPPLVQARPDKTRDAALAAAIGLLAGILAAFVATAGDTRVRNEAAVARVTDLPVLGTIDRARRRQSARLIVAREPHSPIAEDMRRIVSALAFSSLDSESRRLLITSPSPGEGKSTFATNLALTFVDTGARALVVDVDLRRPRVGEMFGHDGAVGLTTVLVGDASLQDAVISWGEHGPDVLGSGAVPPNPAAVVSSQAFRSLLDHASQRYDVVVIDSPPVLTVADSNLLAPLADGVVIVVDASGTRRHQLAETVRAIESAGGRILGIVLNKARSPRHRNTYYADVADGTRDASARRPRARHSPTPQTL
jgi:capsular exopolysaccharide synthesis family protein